VKKTTLAISVLAVALVGSNAYWAYTLLDHGVSYSYLNDSYRTARDIARQALAVIPAAANPSASRESIIAAAKSADPTGSEPFEKDGHLWVGSIGLRFDEAGKLVGASPAVEPF
jgi:hypothetical protein